MRVAHPELRKRQGEVLSIEGKVFDEAHSENVKLHPNTKTEGNTSCGNTKVTKDFLKHTNREGRASRKRKVRDYAYDMQGHTQASVARYLELAGKPVSSLQPVATPCLDDHLLNPDVDINPGKLKEESTKIVLNALYVARYNRIDLLWSVNALARE